MKRAPFFITIAIVIASLLAGLFTLKVIFLNNNVVKEETLFITSSGQLSHLEKELKESGVLKNLSTFRMVAKLKKLDGAVKSGRYVVKVGQSNRELINMFRGGLQTPATLVLSGRIRTADKLAATLSSQLLADSSQFITLLESEKFIDSLGFTKESFPAMFSLNSYEVWWTTSPKSLIERLHSEYKKFWNSERLAKAKTLGLTEVEVTTIASIIEEETNLASEYRVIAGVYLNRLRRGMLLQADPTVKFALNDHTLKRILLHHLKVDSPYNTYKYVGLPPGPITIVSPATVDAVLNYDRHNYLYFCADAALDGSHKFATSYREHLNNARAYHRAIDKLKL